MTDDGCESCAQGIAGNECPQTKRPCGHHCECLWSQDVCHWCGVEITDSGEVGAIPEPPSIAAPDRAVQVAREALTADLPGYCSHYLAADGQPYSLANGCSACRAEAVVAAFRAEGLLNEDGGPSERFSDNAYDAGNDDGYAPGHAEGRAAGRAEARAVVEAMPKGPNRWSIYRDTTLNTIDALPALDGTPSAGEGRSEYERGTQCTICDAAWVSGVRPSFHGGHEGVFRNVWRAVGPWEAIDD